MSCDLSSEPEPEPPPRTTPESPPRDPGPITQPDLEQVGELNARSEHLGRVFAASDGSCFVRVIPNDPLPPGATGPTQAVPCPEAMTHPSFAACDFGVIRRQDAESCICAPWGGNPPPPRFDLACPELPSE